MGTHLYGRRMYETMKVWDDPAFSEGQPAYIREFAELWRDSEKVVYSRTLAEATTARTTIERELDPEAVREMKAAAGRDLLIGGPTIAARAFEAGLVDEVHLVVAPIAVGGGKPALPRGTITSLELLDERRFASGMVHLHYRVSA